MSSVFGSEMEEVVWNKRVSNPPLPIGFPKATHQSYHPILLPT